MNRRRPKKPGGGKIEKSEDRAWQEWFETLDVKEHEKYLSQLGLDKEDIEEWEEAEGYKPSGGSRKKQKE